MNFSLHVADCIQVPVLYISTDYVFDGKSPPYAVDAVPNPLNLYGKTKLYGEEVTLAFGKGNYCCFSLVNNKSGKAFSIV
jgi:dTDP-4-dehydrorhamnose reductase